ncbi:MAG: hydantoinase/oxoprolinase family protein [Sphingomonadales bacterium]|nr:hydantoinase/oxoprolinase family protein [Sphingomonadales bacterium]
MRIGVDVGGTNTDAVVMSGVKVVSWFKSPTTDDIATGIITAIKHVLSENGIPTQSIGSVMIGTTQFTNALVERKKLVEAGIIRIALPATASIPPLTDWPKDLVDIIGRHIHLIAGGYEYDGRQISRLDEIAILKAAQDFKRKGLCAIAISCVFSPMNMEMEQRAAEIVRGEIPEAKITLSSEVGRLGLLERENAAILNASLSRLAAAVVKSCRRSLDNLGISSPIFISQNDGTLMGLDQLERFPIMTFASGPTNSMRGAAFLSNLEDAIVIDIGGTTTDIGVLVKGFPRQSAVSVDIGGVRTNFRMPDILSVGLGGGSLVRGNGAITVGPDSVGFKLTEMARIFGGETLTATDIVVAAGLADIGNPAAVADIEPGTITAVLENIHQNIAIAVDRMKTSAEEIPVILVGGGSILAPANIPGASRVIIPDYYSVANAIGAAIAQASGEVDKVYSYNSLGRDGAIQQAIEEAKNSAVSAGAKEDSLRVVDVSELPLAYMPGGMTRLRVKVVGDHSGVS